VEITLRVEAIPGVIKANSEKTGEGQCPYKSDSGWSNPRRIYKVLEFIRYAIHGYVADGTIHVGLYHNDLY